MMRVALKHLLSAKTQLKIIGIVEDGHLGVEAATTLRPDVVTLSDRELEVLRLIVEGYTNPEIAKSLYLSEHTVKTYVRGILNKLLVNDRVQAAVMALRSGLMS